MMNGRFASSSYFRKRDASLHLVCPTVPSRIYVAMKDTRNRDCYTSRVWEFVARKHVDALEDYVRHLVSAYVPSESWCDELREMERLGIDISGGDREWQTCSRSVTR